MGIQPFYSTSCNFPLICHLQQLVNKRKQMVRISLIVRIKTCFFSEKYYREYIVTVLDVKKVFSPVNILQVLHFYWTNLHSK